jgi:predicted aspartyl protease
VSTTFNPRSGLILVPVQIWGPSGDTRVELVLDTGASSTLVRSSILLSIGYDPGAAPTRVQMTTASGISLVPRFAVDRVEALGSARSKFLLVSHELPPAARIDGVLGLDFLRGQRLTIDFRRGSITLR